MRTMFSRALRVIYFAGFYFFTIIVLDLFSEYYFIQNFNGIIIFILLLTQNDY